MIEMTEVRRERLTTWKESVNVWAISVVVQSKEFFQVREERAFLDLLGYLTSVGLG